METDNYNPKEIDFNIDKLQHGKPRTNAIRYAVEQADLNNDIPFMIYFRKRLCSESSWYGDSLDVITIYPELLSLIDRYPDTELVIPGDYKNITEYVLDGYESLLSVADDFYQVSYDDCIKFHMDFEKRRLALGFGARESSRMMAEFYIQCGDMDSAGRYVGKFTKCPMETKADDCPGCGANTQICYYLYNNEKEKADKIAEKIEDFTLMCTGGDRIFSLMRMKGHYLNYYIRHGDYVHAAEEAHSMERMVTADSIKEYKPWASFMCAYVHSKPGRGLRIYKSHWKELQQENNPHDRYYCFKGAAAFFKGFKEEKDTDTVKLILDSSFPLYQEDNIYQIDSLYKYYYNEVVRIAEAFDKRNRTNRYMEELMATIDNV